jgi:hypothetical protein
VTHWNLASALLISDYPVLYWMNQAGNDLKVLDYGGNVGNLYYAYRNHLKAEKLEWTVSDLPMMIEAGRTIAKEKNIPVFVDAAAEEPMSPNVYMQQGASFVGYSGGKCLRASFPKNSASPTAARKFSAPSGGGHAQCFQCGE